MMKRRDATGRSVRRMSVESLENRSLLASDCYHNFLMPEDTDGSGSVTPLDALTVINRINQGASGPTGTIALGSQPTTQPPLVDVNADQALSPLDALTVINYLNAQSNSSNSGMRASQVDVRKRIERIEQAIASDVFPSTLTREDAILALDTLKAGGRPELGDRAVNGVLRWKQDNSTTPEPNEVAGNIDPAEMIKRLEKFSEALSERLASFGVTPTVIKTIATEVVGAAQAGTPMDLIQIRTRLGELGVDVDSILPKPFIPEPPTSPAAPQTPERPQLPEKPELPPHLNNPLDPSEMLRKIMPLLGRLRIDREVALTIYKEVQAAAAKGTPMTVEQIVKRLSALGVPLSGVKLPTL